MSYEPSINTTTSLTPDDGQQKTRYYLDRAVEAANREGLGIIGFLVVIKDSEHTVFEPFSSSSSLEPKEFVNLVARASRGMMTEQELEN